MSSGPGEWNRLVDQAADRIITINRQWWRVRRNRRLRAEVMDLLARARQTDTREVKK